MLKSMAEGLVQLESATGIKPALINIEDAWQMGYLLEPLRTAGRACSCPRRRADVGNVMYLPAGRVRPLPPCKPMVAPWRTSKRSGVGSGAALRWRNLAPYRAG